MGVISEVAVMAMILTTMMMVMMMMLVMHMFTLPPMEIIPVMIITVLLIIIFFVVRKELIEMPQVGVLQFKSDPGSPGHSHFGISVSCFVIG